LTSSSGLQAYDLFWPVICRDLVKIRQGELQSEGDQVIFFLNFEQCCNICAKTYPIQMNLNLHLKTVHGGLKDHKCESCGKSFTVSRSLKAHIYTVHEGRKYRKCESCGKSFSQSGVLKRHIPHVVAVCIGHNDHFDM
jgi:ribosomal protein S14